jgi:NTE family protein
MTRVGLVLGAGGIVGQAYHAGVLSALEEQTGWDPRTADLIVGSSAGSLTGAALRLGISTADLVAWSCGTDCSDQGRPFLDAFGEDGLVIDPFDPRTALHGWRLPSRRLLARAARRPWAFRPTVAAITLLPAGQVDLSDRADRLSPVLGDGWPDGLWICTARRDDGARTTFGRPGAPSAPLDRAVAASCAIPGYLAPVEIGGIEYFDGGVHSPTNADVLRGEGLDLVIVSSPMSAAHGRGRSPDAAFRWAAHRRLEREVSRLRAAGTEVVRFEPCPRTRAAMGFNAMDLERSADVIEQARHDTEEYLATDRVARRLGLLDAPGSGAALAAA